MRIFIERFILTILSSFVVLLAAVNPMGFSWPERLTSIIFIVIVAGMAAHFAWDEWRWQRLRGVWWFWSIFGLSGGVALALRLIPRIVGPPKSEHGNGQVAALQLELNTTKQELERAKQDLEAARQPMTPPVRVFLNGGIGLVEVPHIRNMGTVSTINRISLAKDIGKRLEGQDTVLVITATEEKCF